jgi:peptidoglycan/LPS O-acetylase OafA/YrhL
VHRGEGSSQRTRRAPELDLLRVVAAGAVLLYHYTWAFSEMDLGGPTFPTAVTGWSRYGFLGIELFFLISGLVIVHSVGQRPAGRFAVARAIRLYPAYWAAVTVTAVLLIVLGGPLGDVVTPGRYLVNLTMLTGFVGGTYLDHVYWTLTAELSFYAVVWCALVVRRHRDLIVVLAGWLAISVVNDRLLGIDQLGNLLATRFSPFFVTGACLALLTAEGADQRAQPGSWRRRLTWVTLGAAILLVVRATVVRIDQADEALFTGGSVRLDVALALVLGSIALIAAVASGRMRGWGRPWMTTAALVTYPLYLVHTSIGLVVFRRWGSADRWVLLVGSVAAALAVATAIHLAVERPLARRLTRLASGTGRRHPGPVPSPDAHAGGGG